MPPEPVVLVVTALRKGTESQDFLIQYIYVLYSTYSTVHTVQYDCKGKYETGESLTIAIDVRVVHNYADKESA